jgi:hypothetical protein
MGSLEETTHIHFIFRLGSWRRWWRWGRWWCLVLFLPSFPIFAFCIFVLGILPIFSILSILPILRVLGILPTLGIFSLLGIFFLVVLVVWFWLCGGSSHGGSPDDVLDVAGAECFDEGFDEGGVGGEAGCFHNGFDFVMGNGCALTREDENGVGGG